MAASWAAILANPNTAAGTAIQAGTQVDCPGGIMVIAAVSSNWNGATATLNMLGPDGATLLPVSPSQAVFTANGVGIVYLPPCVIVLTVTGGTPTALYASIARVVW
jgi:hypothetical protein